MKKQEEQTAQDPELEVTKAEVIQQANPQMHVTSSQMQMLNISDPTEVVRIAKEINKYVSSNALSITIQKKPYVLVEGWQFTASLLGCVGMVEEINDHSTREPITFKWMGTEWVDRQPRQVEKSLDTKMYRYSAKAVFKNAKTGLIVGQGFAMCTNDEENKHQHDEYAILSHAQTRAIGKAARMAFAFIIKAAGYEPTPAEEMDGVKDKKTEDKPATIPNEIIEKIKDFNSVDDLLIWSGDVDQEQYHKNTNFRNLVSAKQKSILRTKAKK